MNEEKSTWTSPTVEEIDIAEETMIGDGPTFDGADPAPQS